MATLAPVGPESAQRQRYAPIAMLAGALLIVGAIVQLGGVHARVNEETIGLITVARRGSIDIIGGAINAVALVLIAVALSFLWQLTRNRQPAVGSYIRVLALLGGVVTGALGLIYAVIVHQKAHEFVDHGNQSYVEANQLTHSFAFTVLPTIELAAALALALAFVLLSLGAMRVGLLTRFMGYLGILTGVLVLFPIGTPVPVVEGFWLIALGVLYAGRWPSEMPPSWASGKAEPWPSSQQLREERVRAAGGRSAGGRGGGGAGGRGAGGRGAGGRGAGGGGRTGATQPQPRSPGGLLAGLLGRSPALPPPASGSRARDARPNQADGGSPADKPAAGPSGARASAKRKRKRRR